MDRICRLSPSAISITLWVSVEMSSSRRRKRKIRYSLKAMLWRMTKRLSIRTTHRCFRSLANATGLVSANISSLARGSTHTTITSAKATDEK